MAAEVAVRRNEEAGRFEAVVDGRTAFAEYRLLQSGILFPHTEVPSEMEGQGIGGALVRASLDFAREQGLKVMPVCTFFAAYIRKHSEYHDLVHDNYRPALGL